MSDRDKSWVFDQLEAAYCLGAVVKIILYLYYHLIAVYVTVVYPELLHMQGVPHIYYIL